MKNFTYTKSIDSMGSGSVLPECTGSGDQYSLNRFVNTLSDMLIKYQALLDLDTQKGGNADGISVFRYLCLQNHCIRYML